MSERVPQTKSCRLCNVKPEEIMHEHPLALVMRDSFPLTKGHALVIPRRHVRSFFETTREEREAMLQLLDAAKATIDKEHGPDAYNLGVNDGPAAGQTIPHCHLHLIPRYAGDIDDPRGGIRRMFPERADYWSRNGR